MALDVPVYHLDGVVQNRSERESFDGPLDLILLLLSKNKMEIADIQIALILDQYLAWMNQRQTLDLEVASEFVAMAAHLVYIKTRMLLSLQDEEVTSEVEALIASLEARQRSASYSKIQAVLPSLQHRYAVGKDYLPKPPEPLLPAAEYTYQHLPTDLPQALNKLLLKRSAETLPPLSAQLEGIVAREPYPVEEKASEILRSLTRSGTTVFSDLFRDSQSRSEVVATFLAVLELCRGRKIVVTGQGADCMVTWRTRRRRELDDYGISGHKINHRGHSIRIRRTSAVGTSVSGAGAGQEHGGGHSPRPGGRVRFPATGDAYPPAGRPVSDVLCAGVCRPHPAGVRPA